MTERPQTITVSELIELSGRTLKEIMTAIAKADYNAMIVLESGPDPLKWVILYDYRVDQWLASNSGDSRG